ncbi:hypothetical protein F511_42473 [Dorcoceras hygrometricum]|uniref:Uncharacterized protein n=1 Tax=Dorcoceras hygrometricum TaxID=472368 RepID=A0A2Z7AA90_9LAMI|nr:hypothetical protein F511_42473 [Dorcoceras hygrometricum]
MHDQISTPKRDRFHATDLTRSSNRFHTIAQQIPHQLHNSERPDFINISNRFHTKTNSSHQHITTRFHEKTSRFHTKANRFQKQISRPKLENSKISRITETRFLTRK